jgi:hypothetical protein
MVQNIKYKPRNQDPSFYLGETEFTRQSEYLREIAKRLGDIEGIDNYVKHLYQKTRERFPGGIPEEVKLRLLRARSAEEIVVDGFTTGCTDRAMVFCTLSRIIGVPATYVETLEENFLKDPKIPVQGHVFLDVYQNGKWIPYNPDYGKTVKDGKFYLYSPDQKESKYVEIGRGLDFSQLYVDGLENPIELKTMKQLSVLLDKLSK